VRAVAEARHYIHDPRTSRAVASPLKAGVTYSYARAISLQRHTNRRAMFRRSKRRQHVNEQVRGAFAGAILFGPIRSDVCHEQYRFGSFLLGSRETRRIRDA